VHGRLQQQAEREPDARIAADRDRVQHQPPPLRRRDARVGLGQHRVAQARAGAHGSRIDAARGQRLQQQARIGDRDGRPA
jgi:hypothetical protein